MRLPLSLNRRALLYCLSRGQDGDCLHERLLWVTPRCRLGNVDPDSAAPIFEAGESLGVATDVGNWLWFPEDDPPKPPLAKGGLGGVIPQLPKSTATPESFALSFP